MTDDNAPSGDTGQEARLTRPGLICASCAVFALGAALAALWSGASYLQAALAYMLGGGAGIAVGALTILWRGRRA